MYACMSVYIGLYIILCRYACMYVCKYFIYWCMTYMRACVRFMDDALIKQNLEGAEHSTLPTCVQLVFRPVYACIHVCIDVGLYIYSAFSAGAVRNGVP